MIHWFVFWVVPFPFAAAEETGNHKAMRNALFPPGGDMDEAVLANVPKADQWIGTCRWQSKILNQPNQIGSLNFLGFKKMDMENNNGCYQHQSTTKLGYDTHSWGLVSWLVALVAWAIVSHLWCAPVHWWGSISVASRWPDWAERVFDQRKKGWSIPSFDHWRLGRLIQLALSHASNLRWLLLGLPMDNNPWIDSVKLQTLSITVLGIFIDRYRLCGQPLWTHQFTINVFGLAKNCLDHTGSWAWLYRDWSVIERERPFLSVKDRFYPWLHFRFFSSKKPWNLVDSWLNHIYPIQSCICRFTGLLFCSVFISQWNWTWKQSCKGQQSVLQGQPPMIVMTIMFHTGLFGICNGATNLAQTISTDQKKQFTLGL